MLLLPFATLPAHAAAPVGEWWFSNFDHRIKINIPAAAATLATNYAVDISFDHAAAVAAGQSLASGADVRIVRWNGTTWVELDRVLDPDSSWNSATTTIWFRTQAALGVGVTDDNYYLYYGDTGGPGTPLQDGNNVFSLYDDFEAGFDAAKWTRSNNANVTVAGGVLTVNGGRQIRSVVTFGLNTIFEVRSAVANLSPSAPNYYLSGDNDCTDFVFDGYIRFRADNTANDTAQTSAGTTTPSPATFAATAATSMQLYSFTREAAGAGSFFHNGAAVATYAGASAAAMCMFMRNEAGTTTHTQTYQWARVRPYRNPEPIPTLSTLELLPMPTPVAEWRLDQTTWNGTAGEVLDSGPNALHGTSVNTPTNANTSPPLGGDPGTCRYGDFNGTNEYLQINDTAALDLPNELTVTVWVYPRTLGTELKSILSKDENYEFHLNAAGQLNWWWGGGTQELTTGVTVPLNAWTHVAITYESGSQRIYLNGVLRATATVVGTMTVNTDPLHIAQDQGLAGRFWNGRIDEVRIYGTALSAAQVNTVMSSTHPCATVHHFDITHDGFGITCAAVENVVVAVHDSGHNAVSTYNEQITLDTQTGRGTWTLVTGAGTFVDLTANDGLATYVWPSGQSTATFALDYRSAPSPGTPPIGTLALDIDVYQTNNTALRDDDTEGTLNLAPSGFTVTSSPLSNPPPGAIPAFANQTAGNIFNMYITAFGQTPTDSTCGVIEGYTGTKNILFWSAYVDPATGTRIVQVNGANIGGNEGAASTRSIVFTNGQSSVAAPITAQYQDVGRINISLKDVDTSGNPGLPTGIRGATGNFVVRPASFLVDNIQRTSDLFVNPAAATATDPAFIAAGAPFRARVTAQTSTGLTALNFGRESTPESVAFLSNLVAPSGGANPAVAGPIGFASFTNGVATGTDFSWPEVGIITLTPHIRDSDYLGAGDVSGITTGNVGRFIPFDFGVSRNTPLFQTACAAGNFTYVGQPFTYATAPVTTVTARAVGGAVTTNYRGLFFKITNSSLTNRTYTSVEALDTTGLPSTASDPVILSLNNGSGTLTYSAGAGLALARTATPVVPFTAQISLSHNIIDSDSVAAANPVTYTNIAFNNGASQRYGRIAFRNAVGSELLDLPLPMRAEYFATAAEGFRTNTGDSCTNGASLSLTGAGGNLSLTDTCILDTGFPGVSNAGCAVAGPPGQQFRMPPLAGDFVAILRAPGGGNDGTVTVTTVVPAWLRFDWNTATPGQENPSGIATFGLFKGESRRIYQTEK